MASKKVHTQSHPNPEPALVVDNPEQFLRRKTLAPVSVSHIPLHKSPSFSEKPVASQNLDLDTFPWQSLVRTWSDSFVTEIIFDPTVLQPRTPEVLSPTTKPQITPFSTIQSLLVLVFSRYLADHPSCRPTSSTHHGMLDMLLWCWLHHYMPCPKTIKQDFHSLMQQDL
jgi:hypothetical protein